MTTTLTVTTEWTLTAPSQNHKTADSQTSATFHTGPDGRWVDLENAAGCVRRETFGTARAVAGCDTFFRGQGWN